MNNLQEWNFKPPVVDNLPEDESLQKLIGLSMDKLCCAVTPGTYELQEHDCHITLTLYEGDCFLYQESRQFPDGSAEEIASDHRFGRWRVDNGKQMVHLYAPSRS